MGNFKVFPGKYNVDDIEIERRSGLNT